MGCDSLYIVDVLLGVAIGVVGSFVAWLISFRLIAPSIAISPEISRLAPPAGYGSQHLYRVKVRNRRRWRRAIDLEFSCAFVLSGIYEGRPDNLGSFPVPLDELASPRLLPRSNRIAWIRLHEALELQERLPPALQALFDNGSIRLEELLSLPSAQIRFFVRCNDSFSGAPRLEERSYKAGCVALGPFAKDSVNIDEMRSGGRENHELLWKDLPHATAMGPTGDSTDEPWVPSGEQL